MNIRKATKEDFGCCLAVAEALPEWFDANGLLQIEKDLHSLPTYVCEEDIVIAYVCIKEISGSAVEITQLAVDRTKQRAGVGTELIEYIEQVVAPGKTIEVKTLDESAEYKPYERTRAFYKKNGFVKREVIDPYPGWGPGNPCAIYVKTP